MRGSDSRVAGDAFASQSRVIFEQFSSLAFGRNGAAFRVLFRLHHEDLGNRGSLPCGTGSFLLQSTRDTQT